MRRIRCVAVLLAFVLLCVPISGVAEGGLEFEIKSGSPVAGSDVDVIVAVKANTPGWVALMVDLEYDPNVMTLKAGVTPQVLTNGPLAAVNPNFSSSLCRIVVASATNITAACDLVKFTFTVKPDAAVNTSLGLGLVVDENNTIRVDTSGLVDAPTETPQDPGVVVGSYKLGDVNLDGVVDSTDAVWILQHFSRIRELSSAQISIGDVNHDGTTDSSDAVWVLQAFARLRTLA